MVTANDQRLAEMKATYPNWDIWYIVCARDPTRWCCRPRGAPKANRQEWSPEALDKWLADNDHLAGAP
jgi:hypothetical protein